MFEIEAVWKFCLVAAVPIAGVVGWAIQLRTVKKLRLEHKKLELEIEALEKSKKESDRRVVIATNEEVYKLNDIRFSRKRTHDSAGMHFQLSVSKFVVFERVFKKYSLYFLSLVFVIYLIYDFYRLALLLWSAFS